MKTLFQSTQGDDLRQSVEALIGKPVELTVFHGGRNPETEVVVGTLTSLYSYGGGNRGADTIVRVDDTRTHVGTGEHWTLRVIGITVAVASEPPQPEPVNPGWVITRALKGGMFTHWTAGKVVGRVGDDSWLIEYVDVDNRTLTSGRFGGEIYTSSIEGRRWLEAMPIEDAGAHLS